MNLDLANHAVIITGGASGIGLATARLFAEVASRLRVPPVIGELVAGVVLGPSLLGWIQPTEVITLLAGIGIILLGIVLGMAYTFIMDFSSWIVFYRAVPNLFIPTFAAGLPFGALHITGNVIFALVLGKPVLTLFKRFQRRFHVKYDSEKPPLPSESPVLPILR